MLNKFVLDKLNCNLLTVGSLNNEVTHLISGCVHYERVHKVNTIKELSECLKSVKAELTDPNRKISLLMDHVSQRLVSKSHTDALEQRLPEMVLTDLKLKNLILVIEEMVIPNNAFGSTKISHCAIDVSGLYAVIIDSTPLITFNV